MKYLFTNFYILFFFSTNQLPFYMIEEDSTYGMNFKLDYAIGFLLVLGFQNYVAISEAPQVTSSSC